MRIAITGGTGALGKQLISDYLKAGVERIAVVSRDEHKHAYLEQRFGKDRLRCFNGDVRKRDRLTEIFSGCEVVIHAAALKRIDGATYNHNEIFDINANGTQSALEASLAAGVRRFIFVSSDKAVNPENLYGNSKQTGEFRTVNFNGQSFPAGMRASCVRYGNVFDSTGSVSQVWREKLEKGERIDITDPEMTRFHLTLAEASLFVRTSLSRMIGGEIFVPKLPSYRLGDLFSAMVPKGTNFRCTGRRPGGEKYAEALLSPEEATRTLDDSWAYVVAPSGRTWSSEPYSGKPVNPKLRYLSCENDRWLTVEELRALAFPEVLA